MRPSLHGRAALVALVGAAAAACSSQSDDVAGFVADKQAPTVAFDTAVVGTPGDSAVAFTVVAADNLDISRVHVDVTGGVRATVDSTIRATTTRYTLALRIPVPSSVAAGTPVYVVARARDGAGNETVSDTLRLSAGNVPAPRVTLSAPAPASLFVNGKKTSLTLVASSSLKVRAVGYRTSGPFASADSVVFTGAAIRDSVVVVDTLAVPADAPAGVLTVRPFVIDAAGRRADGPPVTYAVQSVSGAGNSVPVPTGAFPTRIEVSDTVRVAASDPTGIKVFGYEVVLRDDTTRRLGADSVVLADASLTNDTRRFTLRLRPDTLTRAADTLPLRVQVRTFAVNGGGTRAVSSLTGTSGARDTALVVAGVTTPLPDGGRLADGLYVPRYDRLYLSNIDRNQIEVFDLATRAFRAPAVVGSQPWGMAAWPRAHDGTSGDTLLVANSGGTSVSYVDITAGAAREVYRYPLPNIVAYSVTTVASATDPTVRLQQRTVYDFSDRPQYLATACAGDPVTGGAGCTEPLLVYSTTPTPGQTLPFPRMGTIRWENLRRHSSHFFFEQAVGQSANRADSLVVERFAAQGVGADSTLVPFTQTATPVGGGPPVVYSITVDVPKLGFRDTTFVRNSGDFTRAIFGEGGPVLGSRALMYDASRGFATTTTDIYGNRYRLSVPVVDQGVSRATDVTDFIANSFARVTGVAINFDGAIGAVRGDSTYLVDPTLRLQGLLQTSGGANAGLDFHPANTGPGLNAIAGTRYAFAASQLPQLEIYDTYCYKRVSTIPVRDPIIGPIRASVRANGQLILVGATARGVVVVPVPQPIRSSCS